jgi:hypothetical protein
MTEEQLNHISMDRLNSIVRSFTPQEIAEFNGVPGKEHYRLFSYFAQLFEDSVILDIGTKRGSTALALSINASNTVYSFDETDRIVNNPLKHLMNIEFHRDNLLNPDVCKKWEETILKSAFICLHTDVHNGTQELNFYHYLKKIGYQGFMICNNIWEFKDMRDNFWYKLPEENRYDLTHLGHLTGTGIITFNDKVTFPKRDNSMWTLVTSHFKISDADEERQAHEQSIATLSLPYNLVVYCDKESHERIQRIRPDSSKTKYIICEFDQFTLDGKSFEELRTKIDQNRKEKPYRFDDRNTPSYYLGCMWKYTMLKEVMDSNPFKSTHFGWINFCIERMGYQNIAHLDEALSIQRNKFSTCYIDYIPSNLVEKTVEYFRFGRCSMCNVFLTGNAEYMYKVCDLLQTQFLTYLDQGYGHSDEQLYSPVYFAHPELFDHYYGDYQQIITNYVHIYEDPAPPIYNFIAHSFQYGNYEKCFEACEFVWRSYCLNKCVLNDEYMGKLCTYYMKCKQLIK